MINELMMCAKGEDGGMPRESGDSGHRYAEPDWEVRESTVDAVWARSPL
jgi:hypothetical protein